MLTMMNEKIFELLIENLVESFLYFFEIIRRRRCHLRKKCEERCEEQNLKDLEILKDVKKCEERCHLLSLVLLLFCFGRYNL